MAYWLEHGQRSCDLCFYPSFASKFSFITKQQKQQWNNRDKLLKRHGKCLKGQSWSCWQWGKARVNVQKRGGSLISEVMLVVSVCCCPKWGNIFCLDRHESEISAALVLPLAIWPSVLSLCALADSNTFTENKPVSRLSLGCPELESCVTVESLSDVRFLWCSFSR